MVHIIGLEGEMEGKRLALTADTAVLGRNPSSDMVIDGPSVSGTHCRIDKTAEGYCVVDLDSTNGTRVNNTRIETRLLRQGDILTLGTTSFRVEGDELPPPAEPPADASKVTTSLNPSQMRPRTLSDTKPVSLPKDFVKRSDSRRRWVIVVAVVLVLIVLAAALFLRQMWAVA